MHPIINRYRVGLVAGLALLFVAQTNHSQAASPSGGLRCAVAGDSSHFLGSTRALDCLYISDDGRREHYRGTIDKFGLDIGYQRRGAIYWAVLSPDIMGRPGELAGHYIGGSAGVAIGPGVHANALIGGKKIMLNPVSFGDANGLNIAATLTDLQLVYVDQRGRRG
jgi:hypothetical protein